MAREIIAGEEWEVTETERCLVRPAPPEPIALNQVDFIDLCQTSGGMTDEMLVACKNDPRLEVMWIKFAAAPNLHKSDPRTQAGISALDALGYLPNGGAAMNDGWPVL